MDLRGYSRSEAFFPYFLVIFGHTQYMLHILGCDIRVVRPGLVARGELYSLGPADFPNFPLQ